MRTCSAGEGAEDRERQAGGMEQGEAKPGTVQRELRDKETVVTVEEAGDKGGTETGTKTRNKLRRAVMSLLVAVVVAVAHSMRPLFGFGKRPRHRGLVLHLQCSGFVKRNNLLTEGSWKENYAVRQI